MAAVVQEQRLQMNRLPLDKWSTLEQLCLASAAVSCSGDQNWISVSRTVKLVCGATNRPEDWFSQKSCALQYGQLLENVVDTPKRRKRGGDSSSTGAASPVETPTEQILRRLTEERVQELKAEIQKEQEDYALISSELKSIQSGQMTEEELLEMWREIEQQQETQRIEEMKLENQMRERERQKQEVQRNWRSTGPSVALAQKAAPDTTTIDMDVEEIIGTGMLSSVAGMSSSSQQQQTATSPLLSSLLKSPTGNTSNASTVSTPSTPSARAAAPTITTLLTSGLMPNPNQPAIILNSAIPANEAIQLLTRPISGPPVDTLTTPASSTQNLLSPSQSAPTLSMLLEKNKICSSTSSSSQFIPDAKMVRVVEKPITLPNVDDTLTPIIDSNNEEVPMDIEEDIIASAVANSNTDDFTSVDFDEPDPNEEQQLLEVFKNIGELDIDVAEVDFLKGVDEDPPNGVEKKLDDGIISSLSQQQNEASGNAKNEDTSVSDDRDATRLSSKSFENSAGEGKVSIGKTETISSDDSNDNIPLAAVASLENKERGHHTETSQEIRFLKEKVESAIKNEDAKMGANSKPVTPSLEVAEEDNDEAETLPSSAMAELVADEITTSDESTKHLKASQKSPTESDVIVIPTDDDESNEGKQSSPIAKQTNVYTEEKRESQTDDNFEHVKATDNVMAELNTSTEELVSPQPPQEPLSAIECDTNALQPPTISIADTDEDSSTDASTITRKDDKISSSSKLAVQQQQQQRKSLNDLTRIEQHKADDDATLATHHTPARPPMLRKLRDRDRSESPMIDDDTTTTSDHSANQQRSRRRYSSTPVIDSIPNSPASSDRDDRETRASKKSLLSIYNALQPNKNAPVFQRATSSEEHTPKYEEVCMRPIDLQTIKKNIELGAIRSVSELQRDILLMTQNALMVFKTNSPDYRAALAFMQECQAIREFVTNSNSSESTIKAEKETKESKSGSSSLSTSAVKVRGSSRKSQRIS